MKLSALTAKCFSLCFSILLSFGLTALLCCPPVLAQATGTPGAATPNPAQDLSAAAVPQQARDAFRQRMAQTQLPGNGCFVAHYPNAAWLTTQCGTAPAYPNPLARGLRSNNVGNGNDYFIQVTGNLASATGSFDSITGVSTEYGSSQGNLTVVYPNVYSLQLNANIFSTSACGGAPGCMGWEQFLFSQSQCAPSACIFIEYWLLDHGNPCPAGNNWIYYAGTPTTESGCYMNTAVGLLAVQPLAALGQLVLSGTVSGGADTVMLSTANGDVQAASQDSILNLTQGWSGAEFNIFGDCCASEVFFNSGSKITVRLGGANETTNVPQCLTSFSGPTAETNNLNLIAPCSPAGGSSPAIVFSEGGGGPVPPGITIFTTLQPPGGLRATVQ